MKAADIYVVLAENCSDATDDAGYVSIARNEHVPVRYRFQAKAIDLCDASFVALAYAAEECARDRLLARRCYDASSYGRSKVASCALIRSCNRDSALFRNEKGVDDIDAGAHVAQQPCEESPRHWRGIKFSNIARILKSHLAHGFIKKLRLKSSQAFREPDVRLKR